MIEQLKELEQEAMDNLEPEAYDAIVSNVLCQEDQEIYQSGGLMPEIVWEPNYSGNVLEWMNSEGLGNNIFSTAIECQINSNCSYAGQAMSAESAIDLLPTGPNWSIEDVDLGEISGWIGSLPWPPLNDPSLPDLINEGIKNNLKSRLQKLAGIKKRG